MRPAPVLRLLDHWPLAALAASIAMLAAAHGFQALGYAPCHLCLKQREVYWVAGALALAGWAAARALPRPGLRFGVNLALAAVFLFGAGLAAFHAGVEWKWWPGPTSCTGGAGGVSADALGAFLAGAKVRPPACDHAAWVFLGLSMAGWNALVSLGLAVTSLAAALRERRRR